MFLAEGVEYFDPDSATQRIFSANTGLSLAEANSAAWGHGKSLLERAIAERLDFAFETTLGGNTITGLLQSALRGGIEVRMSYVGLNSPDLHIQRVRSRVRAGGHDIPEDRIRERYVKSRLNLARLLPTLTELRLYDNSEEADPKNGQAPRPRFLLHCLRGKIIMMCGLEEVPEWAKPIFALALRLPPKRKET